MIYPPLHGQIDVHLDLQMDPTLASKGVSSIIHL
jgi:hypothetical protein